MSRLIRLFQLIRFKLYLNLERNDKFSFDWEASLVSSDGSDVVRGPIGDDGRCASTCADQSDAVITKAFIEHGFSIQNYTCADGKKKGGCGLSYGQKLWSAIPFQSSTKLLLINFQSSI